MDVCFVLKELTEGDSEIQAVCSTGTKLDNREKENKTQSCSHLHESGGGETGQSEGRETLCQYDGGLQSLPDNTSVARIDLPSEEEYYGNWRFPYL